MRISGLRLAFGFDVWFVLGSLAGCFVVVDFVMFCLVGCCYC